MRTVALVFLGLLCLSPAPPQERAAPQNQPAAAETAVLAGRIVNSLTGEPVRKANLTLMRSGTGSIGAGPPQGSVAVSDAEGKFRFEGMEPGRYTLSAEKAGFVRQQYGARAGQMGPGTALTLGAGEKVTNLEFKLTPQGVISGKVLDEDGEPLTGVSVQVLRKSAYSSRPMGMMGMSTNDVGEFRVANLAPGTYILRAEHRRFMMGGPVRRQGAAAEAVEDYVPTYYPGATEADAAVPVAVAAGQEVSGITLRMRKGRVYRVSGKIVGITLDRASRVQVNLQTVRRGGVSTGFGGGGGGMVRPDGSFELSSVQPGSYNLSAFRFDTGRPQTLGRVSFTVSDRNIEGLVIQAGKPIEISGRLSVEGDDKAAAEGNVILHAAEGISFGAAPGRIEPNGTFKIEGLSREKYFVSVFGLPESMYVKRVNAGGVDVLENGLDLSQAESAPPLEIVVSPKGAAIQGIVRQEDKPVPGASVTLLPEPIRLERLQWMQRMAATDQNGRFTLKGIAPGEYRLYAWEQYVPIAEMEPEQLKAFERYGVKVQVAEQAQEQVELKLVPAPQE